MTEYELPIDDKHNIKSYTWYALPLSVIHTKKEYLPWIYKTFMQIKSSKTIPENGDHLKYCFNRNFNEVLKINKIEYSKINNLLEFMESGIQNNIYLNCELDEYYIKTKEHYKKKHFIHPSLLYGYDKKNKTFSAVGFSSGMFKKFHISYDDFYNSVKNAEITNDPYSHNDFSMLCYEVNSQKKEYRFSKEEFKNILMDYLFPKSENNEMVYGIDIYKILSNSLQNSYISNIYIKFNTTQLLAEHKKTFKSSLDYILSSNNLQKEFEGLSKEYNEVAGLFESIRMLHIKLGSIEGNWFYITNDSSAKQLNGEISKAFEKEKYILHKILKKLDDIK